MSDKLTVYGQNVRIDAFVGANQLGSTEFMTTFSAEEDAVIHKKQYLNKKRARFDKQVDGYTFKLELEYTTGEIIDAFLAQTVARDSNASIPDLSLQVTITTRDGVDESWLLMGCVGKFGLNAGGRTAETKYSIDGNAEDLRKVA